MQFAFSCHLNFKMLHGNSAFTMKCSFSMNHNVYTRENLLSPSISFDSPLWMQSIQKSKSCASICCSSIPAQVSVSLMAHADCFNNAWEPSKFLEQPSTIQCPKEFAPHQKKTDSLYTKFSTARAHEILISLKALGSVTPFISKRATKACIWLHINIKSKQTAASAHNKKCE